MGGERSGGSAHDDRAAQAPSCRGRLRCKFREAILRARGIDPHHDPTAAPAAAKAAAVREAAADVKKEAIELARIVRGEPIADALARSSPPWRDGQRGGNER